MILKSVFDIGLTLCVVSLMISSGLRTDLAGVASYFRGRRKRLTYRLIAVNVFLIPVFCAFLISFSTFDITVNICLMLLAVAPGAPLILPMVGINKGDMDMAVSQMFLLTTTSFILLPLWLYVFSYLMKRDLYSGSESSGHFIISYILSIFLPLVVSVLVKHYARPLSLKLIPWVNFLAKYSTIFLVIMVVIMNRNNLHAISFLTFMLFIGFILFCALLSVLGIISEANRLQCVTAAIIGGFRNFVVVMFLFNMLINDQIMFLQLTFLNLTIVALGLFTAAKPFNRLLLG